MKHNGVFLLVLLISIILFCSASLGWVDANAQADLASPASPIPTPAPLTPSAEAAVKYVADQYSVSTDDLTMSAGEVISFPLLGLSYEYYVVMPKLADSKVPIVSLLVDPATGAIETDVNAIQQKEDEAYAAKYGKLHPTLFDRLQTAAADELLPVAVWVAQDEKAKSPEALEAEAAAQFPEAGEALAKNGVAWAVEISELADKIFRAYADLMNMEAARREQPVREWLEQKGYKVDEMPGIPALTATLTAADIEALAKLPQVAQIYLIEVEAQPEADVAVATDRAPAVWRSGFTGAGVRLAILEPGRINSTARTCISVGATRTPGQADSSHKSAVAAMAACNNPTLPGIAPGAVILDADFNGTSQSDFVNALLWSVTTAQPAEIVNMSMRFEYDQSLNLTDRAVDYVARTYRKTLVKSSGNRSETGDNVTSPGKGWNVTTVGNITLSGIGMPETANWSDDEMNWNGTASLTAANLAAKPELVAPGTNIDTILGPPSRTGSSMSAPQVAGASALLMQRESLLRTWPTAVRAILMASAVHNIEGGRTSGEYDGTGALDVALSYQIAQQRGGQATVCNSSCWWDIPTSNTNPPAAGEVNRYLYATSGERIRVAISWYSQADPGPLYTNDRLLTNYDLFIYAPDGSQVAASTSSYNNYEIAEFVAGQSGQYRVRLYRSSALDYNELSNSVGMAWSKQASYLPDVRSYASYWTSTIAVRNDSAEPRPVRTTFFYDNGGYAGFYEAMLQPNQSWRITPS